MVLTIVFLLIAAFFMCAIGFYFTGKGNKTKNWYQFSEGLMIVAFSIFGFMHDLNFVTQLKEELQAEEETIEASWGTRQLNIDNLYEELLNQQIDYPEIVLAQALLETGHFESFSCRERNNLFGLTKRDGTYMTFPHWTYSVAAYKKYIQKYKEVPEDYYKYLERLGYAEDSAYIEKVKHIHKNEVKINK